MLASLYVDGELSPDEVTAFEDQLLASAELQAETESLFVLQALSMEEPAEASKPVEPGPAEAPADARGANAQPAF